MAHREGALESGCTSAERSEVNPFLARVNNICGFHARAQTALLILLVLFRGLDSTRLD